MNEEWYNDRVRQTQDPNWVCLRCSTSLASWTHFGQQPNYETWLNQIVAAYQTHAEGKDRTFSRFLLDLPDVPQDVLNLLRESCVEPERSVSFPCP